MEVVIGDPMLLSVDTGQVVGIAVAVSISTGVDVAAAGGGAATRSGAEEAIASKVVGARGTKSATSTRTGRVQL